MGAIALVLSAIAVANRDIGCSIENIFRSDVAHSVNSEVLENLVDGSVELDFHLLAKHWDRICWVETLDVGSPAYPNHELVQTSKLVGKNICWGWRPDSYSFLLLSGNEKHAWIRRLYARPASASSARNIRSTLKSTKSCVETKFGKARCWKESELSGVQCLLYE